ncbi:MAG: hypothetical protein M3250_08620 [Thermoproteota archaeon]|nr:hypothetical protein [Thermoproteota archaeon]
MDPAIQMMEIAPGLKEMLSDAGFTIETILKSGPSEIAVLLGIDLYVAQIIFDSAKKTIDKTSSLIADEGIS